MSRKNNSYTTEFKKTIVDLVNNGKTIAEVSREYGVPQSNIRGWIKVHSSISKDPKESISLDDYRKLLKEFNSIKEECEILKKAMTIFAKK